MASQGVRYDGRSYHYRIDAVNYARLDRSRGFSEAPGEEPPLEQVLLPTEADRPLMQALAIRFEDGAFHWGEYRYDRLADAVAYATLESGRKPA